MGVTRQNVDVLRFYVLFHAVATSVLNNVKNVHLTQWCTNPGHQVTRWLISCGGWRVIFWSPHFVTLFILPFWRLEFWGGCRIFGRFVNPLSNRFICVSRTLFFLVKHQMFITGIRVLHTFKLSTSDHQILGPRNLTRRELTLRMHRSGVSCEPH